MFVKIFQVSTDEGMSSFQIKNFLKFMLACQEQNILTPKPCLHTLMQTHISVACSR